MIPAMHLENVDVFLPQFFVLLVSELSFFHRYMCYGTYSFHVHAHTYLTYNSDHDLHNRFKICWKHVLPLKGFHELLQLQDKGNYKSIHSVNTEMAVDKPATARREIFSMFQILLERFLSYRLVEARILLSLATRSKSLPCGHEKISSHTKVNMRSHFLKHISYPEIILALLLHSTPP